MQKTSAGFVAIITAVFMISLLYASGSPTKTTVAAATESGPTSPDWYLNVTGLVENPLILNWTTILAMPKTTVEAPLICVGTPTQVLNANWTGVKLQTVLEEAHPSQDAIKVAFYAADSYSTDLPVETAMRDDILLAYEKDDASLNDLRLVVPGKWGYKWISQITRIELVNYNFLGYWEAFGYPDEADITMNSTSTSPVTPEPEVTPTPSPTTTAPPTSATTPSPTPYTTSPSPSAPPSTSTAPTQPTPTPPTEKEAAIPPETVYTISALIIGVLLVVALTFARKRTNKSQK